MSVAFRPTPTRSTLDGFVILPVYPHRETGGYRQGVVKRKHGRLRMHILSYTSLISHKVPECALDVSDRKQIWRLVFPIALLALVIGSTLGGIWHHHANAPADTCPICHLSHQAIAPPPTIIGVGIPAPRGPGPEPQRDNFTPTPTARRLPARAPPA